MDKLLTVEEAAAILGTTDRFPRRLIAERRIPFVKLGTHVRIRESVLATYIEESTVQPPSLRWRDGKVVA
jgi:excisionase family DNA binding protein